jgi:hypothetical protein
MCILLHALNVFKYQNQRDLWTAIILVFCCIWRHQNDVVFNGVAPSQLAIKDRIKEEHGRWWLAKLFRGMKFGFPLPVAPTWQLGE